MKFYMWLFQTSNPLYILVIAWGKDKQEALSAIDIKKSLLWPSRLNQESPAWEGTEEAVKQFFWNEEEVPDLTKPGSVYRTLGSVNQTDSAPKPVEEIEDSPPTPTESQRPAIEFDYPPNKECLVVRTNFRISQGDFIESRLSEELILRNAGEIGARLTQQLTSIHGVTLINLKSFEVSLFKAPLFAWKGMKRQIIRALATACSETWETTIRPEDLEIIDPQP